MFPPAPKNVRLTHRQHKMLSLVLQLFGALAIVKLFYA
jgi:hypothetical protein